LHATLLTLAASSQTVGLTKVCAKSSIDTELLQERSGQVLRIARILQDCGVILKPGCRFFSALKELKQDLEKFDCLSY